MLEAAGPMHNNVYSAIEEGVRCLYVKAAQHKQVCKRVDCPLYICDRSSKVLSHKLVTSVAKHLCTAGPLRGVGIGEITRTYQAVQNCTPSYASCRNAMILAENIEQLRSCGEGQGCYAKEPVARSTESLNVREVQRQLSRLCVFYPNNRGDSRQRCDALLTDSKALQVFAKILGDDAALLAARVAVVLLETVHGPSMSGQRRDVLHEIATHIGDDRSTLQYKVKNTLEELGACNVRPESGITSDAFFV